MDFYKIIHEIKALINVTYYLNSRTIKVEIEKIYDLTFIEMYDCGLTSDLGKQDVAQMKNSGHKLKNIALKVIKKFNLFNN